MRAISVHKGFDLLFKSFFVFDVSYPDALKGVYGFCELVHDDNAALKNLTSCLITRELCLLHDGMCCCSASCLARVTG